MILAKPSYKCKLCDLSFTRECKLHSHSKIHQSCYEVEYFQEGSPRKSADLALDKTAMVCKTEECLENRSFKVVGDTPTIVCHMCLKRFSRIDLLSHHIVLAHPNECALKCDKCLKVFVTPDRYLGHIQIHSSEETKEEEPRGGKISPYSLNLREKSPSKKQLKTSWDLQEQKGSPFLCGICQKTFSCYTNLWNHAWVHSDEKPYVCKACGVGFGRFYRLRYHMAVHSQDRPYQCQHCRKSFKLGTAFRSHQRKQHKIVLGTGNLKISKRFCVQKKVEEGVVELPDSWGRGKRRFWGKQKVIDKIFKSSATISIQLDEKTGSAKFPRGTRGGGQNHRAVARNSSRKSSDRNHKLVKKVRSRVMHSAFNSSSGVLSVTEPKKPVIKQDSDEGECMWPKNEIENILQSSLSTFTHEQDISEQNVWSMRGRRAQFQSASEKIKLISYFEIGATGSLQLPKVIPSEDTKTGNQISNFVETRKSHPEPVYTKQCEENSSQKRSARQGDVAGAPLSKKPRILPKGGSFECITCSKTFKHAPSLYRHYHTTYHKVMTEWRKIPEKRATEIDGKVARNEEELASVRKRQTPQNPRFKKSHITLTETPLDAEHHNPGNSIENCTAYKQTSYFSVKKKNLKRIRTVQWKIQETQHSCKVCHKKYWYLQALHNHIEKKFHFSLDGISKVMPSFGKRLKSSSGSKYGVTSSGWRKGCSGVLADSGNRSARKQLKSTSENARRTQGKNPDVAPFKCKLCDKQYQYSQSLRRHVRKTNHFVNAEVSENRNLSDKKPVMTSISKVKKNMVFLNKERNGSTSDVSSSVIEDSHAYVRNVSEDILKSKFPHMTGKKLLEVNSSTELSQKTWCSKSRKRKREASRSMYLIPTAEISSTLNATNSTLGDTSNTKVPSGCSKLRRTCIKSDEGREHKLKNPILKINKITFPAGPINDYEYGDDRPSQSNDDNPNLGNSFCNTQESNSELHGISRKPMQREECELNTTETGELVKSDEGSKRDADSRCFAENVLSDGGQINPMNQLQDYDFNNNNDRMELMAAGSPDMFADGENVVDDTLAGSENLPEILEAEGNVLNEEENASFKIASSSQNQDFGNLAWVEHSPTNSKYKGSNLIAEVSDLSCVEHSPSDSKCSESEVTTKVSHNSTHRESVSAMEVSDDSKIPVVECLEPVGIEVDSEISEERGHGLQISKFQTNIALNNEFLSTESSEGQCIHTSLKSQGKRIEVLDDSDQLNCVPSTGVHLSDVYEEQSQTSPSKELVNGKIPSDVLQEKDSVRTSLNAQSSTFGKEHSDIPHDTAVHNGVQDSCILSTTANLETHAQDDFVCIEVNIPTTESNDNSQDDGSDRKCTELSSQKMNENQNESDTGSTVLIGISCQDAGLPDLESARSSTHFEGNAVTGTPLLYHKKEDGFVAYDCEVPGKSHGNGTCKKSSSGTTLYQCTNCMFQFRHASSLKRHCLNQVCQKKDHLRKVDNKKLIKKTKREKLFRCPRCTKNYSCPRQLEKHLQKRICRIMFHCEFCGEIFHNEFLWEEHMAAEYVGNRKLICMSCKTVFLREADLLTHKRPKECPYCDFNNSCRYLFDLHIRQNHGESFENTTRHEYYLEDTNQGFNHKQSFEDSEYEASQLDRYSEMTFNTYSCESDKAFSNSPAGYSSPDFQPRFFYSYANADATTWKITDVTSGLGENVQENAIGQENSTAEEARLYTNLSNTFWKDLSASDRRNSMDSGAWTHDASFDSEVGQSHLSAHSASDNIYMNKNSYAYQPLQSSSHFTGSDDSGGTIAFDSFGALDSLCQGNATNVEKSEETRGGLNLQLNNKVEDDLKGIRRYPGARWELVTIDNCMNSEKKEEWIETKLSEDTASCSTTGSSIHYSTRTSWNLEAHESSVVPYNSDHELPVSQQPLYYSIPYMNSLYLGATEVTETAEVSFNCALCGNFMSSASEFTEHEMIYHGVKS